MADFAATYGFMPDLDGPWPQFWALAKRVPRYQARELGRVMDGVRWAIAAAFGDRQAPRARENVRAREAVGGGAGRKLRPIVAVVTEPGADGA